MGSPELWKASPEAAAADSIPGSLSFTPVQSIESYNIVAEQKLRTQRILGELLKDGQSKGEIKTPSSAMAEGSTAITELGLTHKQSSNFQKIYLNKKPRPVKSGHKSKKE